MQARPKLLAIKNTAVNRTTLVRRAAEVVHLGSARQPSSLIRFRHPGYADVDHQLGRSNIMFDLPRVDCGGVHLGTALSICSIVTGNRHGHFSATNNGLSPGKDDFDEILTGSDYYFHVNDKTEENSSKKPYAMCPSFSNWRFPHNAIPLEWAHAFTKIVSQMPGSKGKMSEAVATRDISCRITASRDVCNNAHLIPGAERDWFLQNNMKLYNLKQNLAAGKHIDDIRNGVLMRQDLHTAFDSRLFTLAVKNMKPVVHFLSSTYDLGRTYHNTQFRIEKDSCAAYYFARFAWSIFPLVENFHRRPDIRLLNGDKHETVGASTLHVVHKTPSSPTKDKNIEAEFAKRKLEYDTVCCELQKKEASISEVKSRTEKKAIENQLLQIRNRKATLKVQFDDVKKRRKSLKKSTGSSPTKTSSQLHPNISS